MEPRIFPQITLRPYKSSQCGLFGTQVPPFCPRKILFETLLHRASEAQTRREARGSYMELKLAQPSNVDVASFSQVLSRLDDFFSALIAS